MRRISAVRVQYEDGTYDSYAGVGSAQVVSTYAPPDEDSAGREYRYLSVTLDLPVLTEAEA